MRKIIKIIGFLLIILFLLLTQFGIQIGNVRIGKQIELKTKQKNEFENSSFKINYYSKNKLTVLNIWATWCKPCIAEIPELNSVKSKYSSEKINFISISVDKDSIKLNNFNKLKKFNFIDITFDNLKYRNAILNVLEGNKPNRIINSTIIPITYLIKDNKVLAKIDGTIDVNDLILKIEKYK